MARTAGRSADDTRRLILDAAARVIGRRGTTVPVTEIADAAGVSKGGLLYHFPNKESLLTSLATDLMTRFREEIEQVAAAEPEGIPGRLARAYIRIGFAHAGDAQGLRDHIALAAHLMFEPVMEELAQNDASQWRTALLDDGLDPAVVRLIVAATDGASTGPLWGTVLDDADRTALEEHLLTLTRPSNERAPS